MTLAVAGVNRVPTVMEFETIMESYGKVDGFSFAKSHGKLIFQRKSHGKVYVSLLVCIYKFTTALSCMHYFDFVDHSLDWTPHS